MLGGPSALGGRAAIAAIAPCCCPSSTESNIGNDATFSVFVFRESRAVEVLRLRLKLACDRKEALERGRQVIRSPSQTDFQARRVFCKIDIPHAGSRQLTQRRWHQRDSHSGRYQTDHRLHLDRFLGNSRGITMHREIIGNEIMESRGRGARKHNQRCVRYHRRGEGGPPQVIAVPFPAIVRERPQSAVPTRAGDSSRSNAAYPPAVG